MNDYGKEYERWLSGSFTDEATKAELKAIKDEKEIEDRFYKSLAFGTGGLRGVMGAGTNRMNAYTVGKASQGLADFLVKTVNEPSAVIAYDSRNRSEEFARLTATVFAANGVKTYLFSSLRPTPELSFAVRYLKASAGVVITASHNPPEYNGYKVYFSDGGQIVPPYDKLIIDSVNAVPDFSSVKKTDFSEALKSGAITLIDKETDDAFIGAIKSLTLSEDALKSEADKIKIVYTPLCGAGRVPVLRVLKELGFTEVYVVKEQEEPNGDFPTLKYPNPEDPAAFTLALKLAKEKNADIILATDPDSDRLGVYFRKENGEYLPLTGNASGTFILEYILARKKEKGLLPENPQDAAVVTTIVSTDMAKAVCKSYGVTLIEVLTGFKYIGEKIKSFEDAKRENGGRLSARAGAYEYIFGFEESYGSLVGDYARDKDAVGAAATLCEAAAYYKSQGKSLSSALEELYAKYGYYREGLHTETLKGADGAKRIKELMKELRENPKKSFGGAKILKIRDYATGVITDTATGKTGKTDLPASDVLYYELEDGWCCARPSGTEPKIKFYYGVKADSLEEADKKLEAIKNDLLAAVNA